MSFGVFVVEGSSNLPSGPLNKGRRFSPKAGPHKEGCREGSASPKARPWKGSGKELPCMEGLEAEVSVLLNCFWLTNSVGRLPGGPRKTSQPPPVKGAGFRVFTLLGNLIASRTPPTWVLPQPWLR